MSCSYQSYARCSVSSASCTSSLTSTQTSVNCKTALSPHTKKYANASYRTRIRDGNYSGSLPSKAACRYVRISGTLFMVFLCYLVSDSLFPWSPLLLPPGFCMLSKERVCRYEILTGVCLSFLVAIGVDLHQQGSKTTKIRL